MSWEYLILPWDAELGFVEFFWNFFGIISILSIANYVILQCLLFKKNFGAHDICFVLK